MSTEERKKRIIKAILTLLERATYEQLEEFKVFVEYYIE